MEIKSFGRIWSVRENKRIGKSNSVVHYLKAKTTPFGTKYISAIKYETPTWIVLNFSGYRSVAMITNPCSNFERLVFGYILIRFPRYNDPFVKIKDFAKHPEPTFRQTLVRPWISQGLRIVDRVPAEMILGLIRIQTLFAHKESSLLHIHHFILEFLERIPEVASVAKAERFLTCGKRLTQRSVPRDIGDEAGRCLDPIFFRSKLELFFINLL